MDLRHSVLSLRVTSLIFATIGCLIIASFAVGQILPLWISALILCASMVAFFYFLTFGSVGAISFLLYGLVALPFVHMLPYLFYDVSYPAPTAQWKPGDPTIWGLATNPYFFDIETIKLTAELGAAGISGLLAGMFAAYDKPGKIVPGSLARPKMMLNIFWFAVLLALALFASNLAAPATTIFDAAYVGKGTASESMNFGSLGLISYSLLILCFADAMFSDRRLGIWKLVTLAVVILYVVVWLQFARGDRESVPMVIACAILFWMWGAPRFAERRSKVIALRILAVVCVIAVIAAGFVLQQLRLNLAGKNLSDIVATAQESYSRNDPVGSKLSSLPAVASEVSTERGAIFNKIDRIVPKGTWSAVLLTPLSVAGDDLRGILPLKLGQTYVDLVLSIPPGFVASRLGYQRPIDAEHGPAHEMRYGEGGTHAVVVPFMNFRIVGVVLIFAVWGWLFVKLELQLSNAQPPLTVQKVAGFGMICAIIPQWVWYGEKILITGFFIWLIISVAYFFAARSSLPNRS